MLINLWTLNSYSTCPSVAALSFALHLVYKYTSRGDSWSMLMSGPTRRDNPGVDQQNGNVMGPTRAPRQSDSRPPTERRTEHLSDDSTELSPAQLALPRDWPVQDWVLHPRPRSHAQVAAGCCKLSSTQLDVVLVGPSWEANLSLCLSLSRVCPATLRRVAWR